MPRYQHPLEIHGFGAMVDEGLDVKDLEVKDLLFFVLAELRVMNRHLALMTDEEIDISEEMET
ncbi:MAG: hypothetical protein IMY71_03230 [Bacteroidetes bacterium]|nr:hypothetical protein [Bacteroidota bacterium]